MDGPKINTDSGGLGQPALREIAEAVFQALPLGLLVFDRRLSVTHANPGGILIARPGESVAQALAARTAEGKFEDWEAELRRVLERRLPSHFQHRVFRDAENREVILNLTCSPLAPEPSAEPIGGLLVIEDVTASIGLEKRLAVSERMAALGKLAARVAHELNNPLDGILRFLGLAQRVIDQNEPEKARRYLEESRRGLLRMVQIVTDLLAFSRSGHPSYEDTSLNTIIEEAVRVMSDEADRHGVSIICSFEDGLPVLRGGSNLFQVFCNIIKNAIDAMPEGGTLSISSTIADRETIIRFEDTGPGLPDAGQRIFEPFFTTKPPGKGTGLGLAISRDIVEKYHGRLTAENRPEGGARFTVRIPLESGTPRRPAAAAVPGRTAPERGSTHA